MLSLRRLAAALALACLAAPALAQDAGITVYTSQHQALTQAWADAFTAKTGIPVAFTLLGQGSYPESKELGLGLMGMHGHRHVNKALDEADLLVNIGARFDDRATGKVSGFAPKAEIVHVDIDPAEIGKNVETKVPVVGDAREVIDLLIDLVDEKTHDEWFGWIESQRNYTANSKVFQTGSELMEVLVNLKR